MAQRYYCDKCGHVFNTPAGSWSEVDGRDEDETHCPKCKNRDYEPLNEENDSDNQLQSNIIRDLARYLYFAGTLVRRLRYANRLSG